MNGRIRILATSDVHGIIYPTSYADGSVQNYGLARIKTLIKALKDENTLVIDNGDLLEGSPLSFFHYHQQPQEICPLTAAANDIGYDYVCLGNHDFNYGEDALMAHLHQLKMPCITSNILYRGKPLGPTYVVRQLAGKKVALFAVVTSYIPHWESKDHIRHFKFTDAVETAKHTVELLRRLEKPDYIICVYHGGFERDLNTGNPTEDLTGENQGWQLLKDVPGIDVLISGHQHHSFAVMHGRTAITQTADSGKELACIDIQTDADTIDPRILKADTEPDQELMQLIQPTEDACQKWLDQALGTSNVDLKITDENDARLHKSQLVTFLNQVQLDATGADLSATALFLGATGFGSVITMRNLVSTYLYPNTLCVKKISGRVLRDYLEKDAEFFTIRNERIAVSPRYDWPNPQHYNYDMLDGIDYTIKVSNDIGSRIQDLSYQGRPVTDDMEFTLALNNFRASGGGNFGMLKDAKTVAEYPSSIVDLIAEYILKHQVIDFAPVNNITVIR